MMWAAWAFFKVMGAVKKANGPKRMLYKWDDGTITTIDRRDLGLALEAEEKNLAQHQGLLGHQMMFGPFTTTQLRAVIAVAQEYETIDLALVAIAAHANWAQDQEDSEE